MARVQECWFVGQSRFSLIRQWNLWRISLESWFSRPNVLAIFQQHFVGSRWKVDHARRIHLRGKTTLDYFAVYHFGSAMLLAAVQITMHLRALNHENRCTILLMCHFAARKLLLHHTAEILKRELLIKASTMYLILMIDFKFFRLVSQKTGAPPGKTKDLYELLCVYYARNSNDCRIWLNDGHLTRVAIQLLKQAGRAYGENG